MDPIRYRKKTRTGFRACMVLLGLCACLLCVSSLRRAVWRRSRAALSSTTLLRTVVFLETGLLPERSGADKLPVADRPERAGEASAWRQCAGSQTEEGVLAPAASTEAVASAQTVATAEAAAVPKCEAEATQPAPVISFSPEEAEAILFRGNCSYEVDKAALLQQPLDWPDSAGPKLLIIHSHSCEAYTPCEGHSYQPSADYRTLDLQNNVVAVGDELAQALAARGVELIHDRTLNDYPDYNRSYAVAREKIQAYLEQYPSIVMVLDLHRDALEKPVREIVELDGQAVAPLMLVIGTDEGGLHHPNWANNLSCGLKLQALANRETPELMKRISFRKQRFNGDLTGGSLIVEVGSTENTLPEACAAMPYLAAYVAQLLQCP